MVVAVSYNPLYGQSGNDSTTRSITLPIVELNVGYGFLFSDNGLTTGLGGSNAQLNYELSINQPIRPYLSAGINLGTTKFSDDIMLDNLTNVNYRTVVFTQDLSFYYEASHLFRSHKRGYKAIQPYLGFGVGIVSFRSKGDLKDETGITYHHWSDGSIRDIAESDPNAEAAVLLMRDRTFESDLRDANLDGLGRYDQLAFRIPLEVGFRYQITKNVGVNVKVRYHMNFTDLIDNISEVSAGSRAGTGATDQHLTTSIGFSAFLGRHTKKSKSDLPPPLISVAENSGTTDTKQGENEQGIEPSAESSSNSEALDVDGIQNSSSEEYDATADNVRSTDQIESQERSTEVSDANNADQKELTENVLTTDDSNQGELTAEAEEAANPSDTALVQVEEENMHEKLGSDATEDIGTENESEEASASAQTSAEAETDILEAMEGFEGTEPKEVGDYHWADINQDRYISSAEVLHFIDLLFDGGSEYDVPMIHSLIEYYFDQD